MNNTIIRQATYKDIQAISEIEKVCFNEREAATYEEFMQRYQAFGEWFLVAVSNNQIIGFINGSSTDDMILKDEFYHDVHLHKSNGVNQCVFGLDVLPQYQHLGNARLLLNSYIQLARTRHKQAIILTCKDYLIQFYQSFGFELLGPSLSNHGGASWNDMILYL